MHKPLENIPPERAIIRGSGSITENISIFVDHHIKDIATKHPSYLQDTPHLLRIIHKINHGPKLPHNAVLVTTDLIGAYLNIPQEDGSACLEEALNEREDQSIPSSFIVKLMDLIQKYNIFEFHDGQLWKQLIGVAMGIHPAPPFANIYLAKRIDKQIEKLAIRYGKNGKSSLIIMKRFLDDILKVFQGSTKQLHSLLQDMNSIHPTLKFTMSHISLAAEPMEDRCDCPFTESIPFLDTSLSIENGKIQVDLLRKETSRNQYLLPSSCHPKSTTLAIPFSLSMRIVRICSKPEVRDKRLAELKQLLLARNYPEKIVDSAISKARKIPTNVALFKIKKTETEKGPIFATKYDPRMPAIQQIIAKHWRSMTGQDKNLRECFKRPPLTAFRRQTNLRDLLIKPKIPPPPRPYPERIVKGMKKCAKSCTACPFIQETKEVKIDSKNTWKINKKVNCNTFNIIYLLECQKESCKKRYIGTSGQKFKDRLADHRGYISNLVLSRATGAHWNQPDHSLEQLKVFILEQTKNNSEEYRREREKFFIRLFDTFKSGLNREV